MIENGFVYAIEQYSKKQDKIKAKNDKKSDKMQIIYKKYNKSLDQLDKNELLKSEYKIVIDYIENVLKYPLRWYENLI